MVDQRTVAGGQSRVVSQHRLDSDHHGVGLAAHLLNQGTRIRSSYPLGIASIEWLSWPSKLMANLAVTKGQSGFDVLGESLIQFAGLLPFRRIIGQH